MEENLKQLLLKELCAKLPYGVICQCLEKTPEWLIKELNRTVEDSKVKFKLDYENFNFAIRNIELIKPYLRPMSSMTKEEKEEYNNHLSGLINPVDCANFMIWVYQHQLDIFHFIEKGLALEAPEGMYKIK